jgi:hypothetical protein
MLYLYRKESLLEDFLAEKGRGLLEHKRRPSIKKPPPQGKRQYENEPEC